MKISLFQVKNFRSIKDASLPLSDINVLLGKNNEGKSNILRAMTISMNILERHAGRMAEKDIYYINNGIRFRLDQYVWERDYPKSLQVGGKSKIEDRVSTFILTFKLSKSEINDFYKEIGNNLNGDLPIEIKIGKSGTPSIKVKKQGPGSRSLNDKSQKIYKYISKLISYNSIPAIRTQEDSLYVVERLVSRELESLSDNKDYREAIEKINNLRQPLLNNISARIYKVLKDFIPSIKSVKINLTENHTSFRFRYDYTFELDDGQDTDLADKGDGVKSLVTLGLLQNQWSRPGASIIAIEEPESHLHPEAINRLRETIFSLSSTHQVVITTHNPLFVNRDNIKANIIVDNGTAKAATNIRAIREVLGVKVSDNLYNSKLVVVVEGTTDKDILKHILSEKSQKISKVINNNELSFMSIGGVKNLSYYVNNLRSLVTSFFCIVDNDSVATSVINNLLSKKELSQKEYQLITVSGYNKETEIEDIINEDLYAEILRDNYMIDIKKEEIFKRHDLKWSSRLSMVFKKNGKILDVDTENDIKAIIANVVISNPLSKILKQESTDFISSLISSIEKML